MNGMINKDIAIEAVKIAYWEEDLDKAIQLIQNNVITVKNEKNNLN